MTKASDEVTALVSGLPMKERERRLFMVLQAVIDDSGNEPNQKLYVLGGFLSTQERWAAFSDEWQAVLDRPTPTPLEFYKFTQSRALKKQFSDKRGWTDQHRNERVEALARVAVKHAMRRFEVSMRHKDFDLVRAVPVFERKQLSDHPYGFLALHVVATVATIAVVSGLTDPIDFIFDSQGGFEAELQGLWRAHEGEWRSPMGTAHIGKVFFHDEQRFRPLQAADMWAGCVRHGMTTNIALPETNIIGLGLSGVSEHMDREAVRRFALRLLSEAERRSAAEPHYPLESFDPEKHKRKRKLNRKPRKPTRRERKALKDQKD